jgi:fructose-bisphosphate aldolase, class II
MQSLSAVLAQSQKQGVAVAHFNVSDLTLLKAVFSAARELSVPVIVGASEGERAFMGVHELAAMVRSLREEFDFPIFLNADHTHSLAGAEEAARAGFDSVVFDLSALPMEENIRQTREAVVALKSIRPSFLIEGEIGDIGTGSEIHEQMTARAGLTTPEEARQFVQATGVDVLAPAVGNMHGMSKSMAAGETRKHLNIERIAAIKAAVGIPLTLHGGSGTDDIDFRKGIAAGINVIHINTELRVAWRQSLESSLAAKPEEVVPYKILPPVVEAVKKVVLGRMQLFNHIDSADKRATGIRKAS